MPPRFDNDGFKATASNLPEAILITDSEGRINWANRAFKDLCGYHLKEIIGQKPGTFLQGPGTDRATVRAMEKAISQQKYFQTEILNYHKIGRAYWAFISVTPFFDADGALEGHVGVARDITEKRLETSQLEHDLVTMYRALVSQCSEASEATGDDPFIVRLGHSESPANPIPTSAEPHRRNRS